MTNPEQTEAVKLWTPPFIGILLINLMLFLSFQVLTPTLPVYAKAIGAGDRSIGLLIGLICMASIITRFLAGLLLDTFGRKNIFIIGMVALGVLTFGIGFISTVGLLLVVRMLQGLAWGIASTSSSTMAADIIPRPRLGEGMGYYGLSTALALAVAPAVGLYLLDYVSFRAVSNLATALLALAIAGVVLFSEPPYEVAKHDKAAGRLHRFYEKNAVKPAMMMFFLTAVMGANSSFIAVFAYERGVANIGAYFIVYAIAMILSRPFIGKLIDCYGLSVAVFPALAALAASLVLTAFAHTLMMYCLAGMLFGAGFATGQTAFQSLAVTRAARGRIGAANGTFFVGFDGGMAVGSVVAGFAAAAWGYQVMYLCLLIFVCLAMVTYARLGKESAPLY